MIVAALPLALIKLERFRERAERVHPRRSASSLASSTSSFGLLSASPSPRKSRTRRAPSCGPSRPCARSMPRKTFASVRVSSSARCDCPASIRSDLGEILELGAALEQLACQRQRVVGGESVGALEPELVRHAPNDRESRTGCRCARRARRRRRTSRKRGQISSNVRRIRDLGFARCRASPWRRARSRSRGLTSGEYSSTSTPPRTRTAAISITCAVVVVAAGRLDVDRGEIGERRW